MCQQLHMVFMFFMLIAVEAQLLMCYSVRDALAAGAKIKVVSIDWVHESATAKKKVPEAKYQMKPPKEEKDAQVKSEDEGDTPVTGRKRGRAATSQRSKVKKEEDDEADGEADKIDQEPPAKKAKAQEDGQYWKGGMIIPVDEMAPREYWAQRDVVLY